MAKMQCANMNMDYAKRTEILMESDKYFDMEFGVELDERAQDAIDYTIKFLCIQSQYHSI